jgi:hypothetical protein
MQKLGDAKDAENGLSMTHATGARHNNELPDWMHTCPCGYSLKSAYGFLNQKEISRMMLSHIETIHGKVT